MVTPNQTVSLELSCETKFRQVTLITGTGKVSDCLTFPVRCETPKELFEESKVSWRTAMSTNRFLRMQAGRVLLVGAVFCTVLVGRAESVLAHGGEDISEASPVHSSPSSPSDPSSPEAAGLQAACWALTVP